MRALITSLCLVAITTLSAPGALAVGEVCSEAEELDKYRLLRRLSLDLRTRVPTIEEYESLHEEEEIPDALIDEWIASDAFKLAMRAFHASLLWPNPGNVQFNNVSALVDTFTVGGEPIIDIIGVSRRNRWRGTAQGYHCANVDQETIGWADDGRPLVAEFDDGSGNTVSAEGWVEVAPYWAPDTLVKVCAFVAMEHAVGAKGPCDFPTAVSDVGCGCGADLRWCYGPGVMNAIKKAMTDQVHRLIDTLSVGEDGEGVRPYSDIVLTQKAWTNGTLDFFDKHLSRIFNLNRTMDMTGPGDREILDAPVFTDATWTEHDRHWPHAGVQTLPAYTLRFNTNRARQNRFRIAFTHQYYVPPTQSDMTGCSEDAADITQRCVCRDCHVVVEPLSAYWAFHAEDGTGLLTDTTIFPEEKAECREDLDSISVIEAALCSRFYVTEDEPDTVRRGWLRPLQYATDTTDNLIHPQIEANAYAGPLAWAEKIVASGVWQQSMIQHLWRNFMGRDMNLDISDPDHEVGILAELATSLQGHDSLPQIVKAIVTHPTYGRVR